jgi:imidazole glycerol-phosphate synthase subunit HisF
MLRTRVIPALLLRDESLVKTVRFDRFTYIGDPCNTVRIFNELEVDELMLLDITATRQNRRPNFELLADIANECFMPLCYGGGIRHLEDARRILKIGFEKVLVNAFALEQADFVRVLADEFGSQAVVAAIDVKRRFGKGQEVWDHARRRLTGRSPVDWARALEALGAGELLVTSVDREGTWEGLDLALIKSVTDAVGIPVIAHGGAGSLDAIAQAVKQGGASAVATGSMVVFQKRGMGVLVNFPSKAALQQHLEP